MQTEWEAIEDLKRAARADFPVADFQAALHGHQPLRGFLHGSWISEGVRARIGQFLQRADVEAETALRFLQLVGDIRGSSVSETTLQHLQTWWDSHGRQLDLRALARLQGDGVDWIPVFPDGLSREFAGAYYAGRVNVLLGGLGVPDYPAMARSSWEIPRQRLLALRILAWLRPLPELARPHLWPLALGEARAERDLAQAALDAEGERDEGILRALRDATAGVREQAAAWAARLRLETALPILRQALDKEKVERVRLAQMSALERLGAPLDAFLNRTRLLAEARKNLDRDLPANLLSAPLADLRWAHDGAPVEKDILQSLIVQCWRLKNPQPSAFLVALCRHFEGREAWGLELTRWWIAQDTTPQFTAAEIEAMVDGNAQQLRSLYTSLGVTKSDAALQNEARDGLTRAVTGTAIDRKGVLALAGACGGSGVVAEVQAYLKYWYGNRAAQCKALLAMLSYLEAPESVQLLLSVARRFRTKGIQEEAALRLQERAQRVGWSLDDMADLSLPTAGVGPDGTLSLDYGGRTVPVQLNAAFQWSLKKLPVAGKEEDPELVKAAGKQFKQAQKTVKDAQAALRQRLYEAMCCGRSWALDTWQTCLNQHPLGRYVCQSLVWMADEQPFRPTEDGSCIDAEQNMVDLAPTARIKLAHPLLLRADEVVAWQTQLGDYLVIPPFAQLARPPVPKPPLASDDFAGWMVQSFDLRNRAKALGYERGSAEDGGVFLEYRKTLGPWVVRVLFSGSQLPETPHAAALEGTAFEFEKRSAQFADVPPILYSEAYNDLQEMARTGSGYDPDWALKVTVR